MNHDGLLQIISQHQQARYVPTVSGSCTNAKGTHVDLAAQKEAVVNAIRAEINLATAQELITVRVFVMPSDHISHNRDLENFGEMLRKVRSEAGGLINELGRGTFR